MACTAASLRTKQAAVDLFGKNAVVVGGTSGIGEGIAMRLAQADATVIIVGRNAQRGQEIVDEMKRVSKRAADHQFIPCDAGIIGNIKPVCDGLNSKLSQLDFLVLTQGIGTMQGRTETSEGLDIKLSLHYYSRYAFVEGLLPLLKKSSDPRVLSVLSAGVHAPYKEYKQDPELKQNYSLKNAADAAGLYNDLAVDFYSRANPGVTFIHAAPGFVRTSIGSNLPWALRGIMKGAMIFAKSPADCAEIMCMPLFSPEYKGGFHLMSDNGKPARTTALHAEALGFIQAHTQEVMARLLK